MIGMVQLPYSDLAGWARVGRCVSDEKCLGAFVNGSLSGRPIGAFWSSTLIAGVVATLGETPIGGTEHRCWFEEASPVSAAAIGGVVLALIHFSRYGLSAIRLDFGVGLALGGLRTLKGHVLPWALAHTIADSGAWFTA